MQLDDFLKNTAEMLQEVSLKKNNISEEKLNFLNKTNLRSNVRARTFWAAIQSDERKMLVGRANKLIAVGC